MEKEKLLFDMMVKALRDAEDNYSLFTTEYEFEERKPYWKLIKFVWNYWVNEGLYAEIAKKLNIYNKINDVRNFETILTYITYGDMFGFSSPQATEMILSGEVENHITPIREKIEELAKQY